ncbi:MAG TPA: signal peptidase II [Candidatus Aquilonibacter sp.]|nr:signal peptidase II [Candidatus Aquilonibacter sp.]
MPARGTLRDARIIALIIAAVVIALDRWSKLWIEHHIRIGHARVIIPHVFRLTHVLNTGAAFSLFEGSTSPATVRNLLIALSVFAVIVVLALIWKYGRQFTLVSFSLALILGGAIGNLYDRVRYSHVVDFLEVHIIHYHWPDFNVADSCICIGACLLLIEMLRPQHGAKK